MRTGGPARQDTVPPPPHTCPTPALASSEIQTLYPSIPPEGGPRGLLQLWPPCPLCRLLPPALASSEPASRLIPQVQEHGSQGAWAKRGGLAEPRPVLWCLSLGPSPWAQPHHLEPSLAWLALPAAPHPTGPVQPGLFFWDKMRGLLCFPPGPTSFLCGGAAKDLWA